MNHDAIARLLHALGASAPDRAQEARRLWRAASAPVRVRVTGRRWSGVTTVATMLSNGGVDVVDTDADVSVYVLPGSLRAVDRSAIAQLADPIVVLNKADAISPDPAEVERVGTAVAQALQSAVLPLTAHVADIAVNAEQHTFLRGLAAGTDAGARVATIVFGDSPVRSWGPPAVAVAVSALRLDSALDAAGVCAVLRAFSGAEDVLAAVRARGLSNAGAPFGAFLDVLEQAAAIPSVRDDVEDFLAGPAAAEIALRSAGWRDETVADLRLQAENGAVTQRRLALRAERALARRMLAETGKPST